MRHRTQLTVWCGIISALVLGAIPRARAQSTLWGWADLHAHPAVHLAFGANPDGSDGIIWGKPGIGLEFSGLTLGSDMPPCAPDKHGGFDGDAVRHNTHRAVIGQLDGLTGYRHGASGYPGFSDWPHARTLTHQQMHMTALRRAYDGGQRLMIASATDNELLSKLWRNIGYNAAGNPVPTPDAGYDLASAKRQLTFIKQLATANFTWIEVAYSAADARRIIASDKLAIILSVELDSLTPAEILRLVREDGVRHVIPVHLVDNAIGGTAVYGDLFNTSNAFRNSTRQTGNWNRMNGDGFYHVEYDPRLSGRLGRPNTLVPDTGNLFSGGAMYPTPIDDGTFASLGYTEPASRGGHKNARGLSSEAVPLFRELAKLGVLIDVVHMSEKSVASTLTDFAIPLGYPVMDSHTGLRGADERATNERALLRAHAKAIADLGGVIGVGTEGSPTASDPIGTWVQAYLDIFTVMHGRGTALGTDINGLAPQIASARDAVSYPIDAAMRFGRAGSRALARSQLGSRSFDFKTDGVAHYGMLADFIQAVSQKSSGASVLNGLFQSANDVVEMWERCESRKAVVGDFNGDGKADVAVWRQATLDWAVQLSTGSGLRQQIWHGARGSNGPIYTGDFNADGKSDLIMWRAKEGDWAVNLSTGSDFAAQLWRGGSGSEGPIFVGDFNGDRKSDILIWRWATRDWRVDLSTGAGFNAQLWRGGRGSDGPIFVGDLNGDGKSDVFMSKNSDHSWTVNLSTGSNFTTSSWTGVWGADGPIQVGDFNGDHKTDVIMWRQSGGDWTVNLSTGTGFHWDAWRGAAGTGPTQVGDFNGDGKSDLAIWRDGTRDWALNLSTGSGFDTSRRCAGAWATDGPIHVGDFSGDGKTDIMMFRQAANDWTVNISTNTGCAFYGWSW